MPPRIRLRSLAQLVELHVQRTSYVCSRCQYATASAASATTTVPAPSQNQIGSGVPPTARYHPLQPPSHRSPAYRKSQLLRSYVSLLESTPLILIFQHSNLKASEWLSIRRELHRALQKVDEQLLTDAPDGASPSLIANAIKLEVIQTKMFEPALRIVEYYKPDPSQHQVTSQGLASEADDPSLTHALSRSAYKSVKKRKGQHDLSPLLTGSLAIMAFPTVSPQHMKAALSILTPSAPAFPAPTRRANPTYHEPPVQDGLKKLMLLGARVDGQVFDAAGTKWVGSIEGGITGLRAQLVAILQGFAGGLTQTLEGVGRGLWITMEERRKDMEEKEGGEKQEA